MKFRQSYRRGVTSEPQIYRTSLKQRNRYAFKITLGRVKEHTSYPVFHPMGAIALMQV